MHEGPTPIDPRGPRTNQAVLALALVLGFVTSQTWVAPLFAAVLFLGAAFGPKWGPVLRLYGAVIRPRLSPPSELEDPRPPRFAASVGVAFLTAASLAFVAGATTLGWILALVVAALAALAATTGLCVGCEMYVLLVRLRGGVRVVTVERAVSDSSDHAPARAPRRGEFPLVPESFLDGSPVWLVFTTEYCAVCPGIVELLASERPGERVVTLDVADHLDLASAYRVRRAPTVVRAAADGTVLARLSGADSVRAEVRSLAATPIPA
jgi:thiol-disulfide isomerase/thioredoxin